MNLNKELSIQEDHKLLVFDDFYQGESFPKEYILKHQKELLPVQDSMAPGIQFPLQLHQIPEIAKHISERLEWVKTILGRKFYLHRYYLRCQFSSHRTRNFAHVDPCEYSLFIFLNDVKDDGSLGFSLVEHIDGGNLVNLGKEAGFNKLSSNSKEKEKWRRIHYVPYQKNRAILVKANLFHTGSDEGIGDSVETARLSEHYFLNSKLFIKDHFQYHLQKSDE